MIHICDGTLLSHKKREIMLFAATWIDLEMVILSKSDRERQISYDITYESYSVTSVERLR